MTDPRSIGFTHTWVPPSRIPEHVLWTLRKGDRTAQARTRMHPLGLELTFYLNDSMLWAQVFKHGTGGAGRTGRVEAARL